MLDGDFASISTRAQHPKHCSSASGNFAEGIFCSVSCLTVLAIAHPVVRGVSRIAGNLFLPWV